MNIPILVAHNMSDVIGSVTVKDGQLVAHIPAGIEREAFFSVFDCGARVDEWIEGPRGEMLIKRATFFSFSLDPTRAPPVLPAG